MVKTLKNPLKKNIKTHFRGRDLIFKSKAGVSFNLEDEEELALYNHWKQTYQFLYDIER